MVFNMFKGGAGGGLTPRLSLAVAMVYMVAADGSVSPEEISNLAATIGGKDPGAEVKRAVAYVKANSRDKFLAEVGPMLNAEQKLCILLNMADSAMADGSVAESEKQLMMQFVQAFGLSMADVEPHLRTLAAKNNRGVLGA